jgi:hypothetical protein
MKNICKLLFRGTSFVHKGKPCECSYMCHIKQSLDHEPDYFPSRYDEVIKLNDVVANDPSARNPPTKEPVEDKSKYLEKTSYRL